MSTPRLKVIVTGGAGYIGSHTVVSLWNAGFEPVIIDDFSRSSKEIPARISQITGSFIHVIEADCTNGKQLREAFAQVGQAAAVIHFAAFKAVGESVDFPAKYYENNIGSLAVLLQVMADFGNPKLVFSSSCTVYGQPDELPVTEASPILPAMSPYGYTKQVCEQLLHDAAAGKTALQAVSLRYFNPIGAHASALIGELPLGTPNNLVPFITQAMAGLRPPLTVFGSDYPTPDGTCIRDYIHVVDLAEAHVAAIRHLLSRENKGVETYNIGSGHGHSVLEVIHGMEKVTGMKVPFRMGERRPGDVTAIWADSNKSLPGWKPTHSLEDALADAWRWQLALMERPVQTDA